MNENTKTINGKTVRVSVEPVVGLRRPQGDYIACGFVATFLFEEAIGALPAFVRGADGQVMLFENVEEARAAASAAAEKVLNNSGS
jgi:hypothetical protein